MKRTRRQNLPSIYRDRTLPLPKCFVLPFELWYTWAHIVKQKFSNKRRRSLYENGTLEIQTTAKINLTPPPLVVRCPTLDHERSSQGQATQVAKWKTDVWPVKSPFSGKLQRRSEVVTCYRRTGNYQRGTAIEPKLSVNLFGLPFLLKFSPPSLRFYRLLCLPRTR